MPRVGKWDEQKILFKGRNQGGHDHFGGARGAHIAAGALATGAVNVKALGTGAVQYVFKPSGTAGVATNLPVKWWFGTVTKTAAYGVTQPVTMGGATGFTRLHWAKVTRRGHKASFGWATISTMMFYNYLYRASNLTVHLSNTLYATVGHRVFVETLGQ